MSAKIALVGNPNCGKTTLFNALTGLNQYVGNWPGVTVEKKEGRLKGSDDIVVVDLPGIYSLSPYTLEEVIARNYLISERPELIVNVIDGSNIERNLYLTTQAAELGIPLIIAVNMMDVVEKNGDSINFAVIKKSLGCDIEPISALNGSGLKRLTDKITKAVGKKLQSPSAASFSPSVEAYISEISSRLSSIPQGLKRFYAVKLFEGDSEISKSAAGLPDISDVTERAQSEFDDDTESIITNERYACIASLISNSVKKNKRGKLTVSDKIDMVVTNRWLALPIFAVVMFIVYYVAVTSVGTVATDWANDGVFGDGWHFLAIGAAEYEAAVEEWEESVSETSGFEISGEAEEQAGVSDLSKPDPADFGIWIPGVPVFIEGALDSINTSDWLKSLVLDGIVAGVGAVLGFVPQMLILFLFLSLLESCGYMARVAFIMDRIFRKFGLSGKSFIPLLIGSGCSIPGIMASRTIENERDRRMTVMTTSFIPCGAKIPVIGLIAGAMFSEAAWVAPSAYFVGIVAVVVSGIILKKTKLFAGDPAPFVMELPAYRMPIASNIFRSTWERGWSFIKKAGTVILLSSVVLWFLQSVGVNGGGFYMADDLNDSILAAMGDFIAPVFAPLGWGDWKASVASVTGLIAKENIVGTFGVLFNFADVSENGVEIWGELSHAYTAAAAYSFLVFNLLCAPCFAAIGAMKREMNNPKWTCFAVAYQTLFAYCAAFCVYRFWESISTGKFTVWTAVAVAITLAAVYFLIRPQKKQVVESEKSTSEAKVLSA